MKSDNKLLKLMFALATALIMGAGTAGCSEEEGAAPGGSPGGPAQQDPGAVPGPGDADDGESEGGGSF